MILVSGIKSGDIHLFLFWHLEKNIIENQFFYPWSFEWIDCYFFPNIIVYFLPLFIWLSLHPSEKDPDEECLDLCTWPLFFLSSPPFNPCLPSSGFISCLSFGNLFIPLELGYKRRGGGKSGIISRLKCNFITKPCKQLISLKMKDQTYICWQYDDLFNIL